MGLQGLGNSPALAKHQLRGKTQMQMAGPAMRRTPQNQRTLVTWLRHNAQGGGGTSCPCPTPLAPAPSPLQTGRPHSSWMPAPAFPSIAGCQGQGNLCREDPKAIGRKEEKRLRVTFGQTPTPAGRCRGHPCPTRPLGGQQGMETPNAQ